MLYNSISKLMSVPIRASICASHYHWILTSDAWEYEICTCWKPNDHKLHMHALHLLAVLAVSEADMPACFRVTVGAVDMRNSFSHMSSQWN